MTFLRYELARIYSDRRESSQRPEPPLPLEAPAYDVHVLNKFEEQTDSGLPYFSSNHDLLLV